MKKIWIKSDDGQMNIKVDFIFETKVKGKIDIKVAAADVFRLSVNGKFIGYGPRRIGKGVSALNEYNVICTSDLTAIKIEVVSYKNDGYYLPIQNAFFAAEIMCDGQMLATSSDFTAYRDYGKEQKVLRYSLQRNFTESYRYPSDYVKQEVCEVNGNEICACDLPYPDFSAEQGKEIERGFIKIKESYENFPLPFVFPLATYMLRFKEDEMESDLVDDISAIEYFREDKAIVSENYYKTYEFPYAMTGFISVDMIAKESADIYFVFDETINTELFRFSEKIYGEYYHNGALPVYWHRLNTVNIVKFSLKNGERNLITIEPYCFKFLRVIVVGKAEIKNVQILKYENSDAFKTAPVFNDKTLNELYVAAQRTFAQCSVDWLIDCPSRERAAWLCDTYFSAKAERCLTGSNRIEKNTLNAFLTLPKEDYSIPEKMIPMCLYVNPLQKLYMPTWAMWFVIEIDDYLARTGDKAFTDKFRAKIYGFIEWLDGYVNEYGLLEEVDGQLFIEWSKANDFTEGVNFPANMLFYKTLYAVYNLFGEEKMRIRAENIKKQIISLSFNGKFFEDNATRVNGKLEKTGNISETCQYYAFYCGVADENNFPELYKTMFTVFGKNRDDKSVYPEVYKSNAFIGDMLRLDYLAEHGKAEQVISECKDYYYGMVERTGTLWEHDTPIGSLVHCFSTMIVIWIEKYYKDKI